MMVDTDDELLVVSGAEVLVFAPRVTKPSFIILEGTLKKIFFEIQYFRKSCSVPGPLVVAAGPAAFDNRARSSLTSPCSAKGAGSTPRRVNLSDNEAKHLRAPSET